MAKRKSPFAHERATDSSGFLLWQVTVLWQRRIAAALRAHELTQVQFALLASLLWLARTEGAITQSTLARHAKLDVMMTSQVLRALEARGLIERRPHPHDTRAKVLRLTKTGRSLAARALPDVEHADDLFFAALDTQRARFNLSLEALIASAQKK